MKNPQSNRSTNPHFTIVMPVYNRVQLVGRAISSVLSQDFTDFEIIVVDDGSSDGSYEEVRRYEDSRIRLFRHTVNRGVCPARNTGIQYAKGDWIVCLDSDDELVFGALNVMHARTKDIDERIGSVRFMCRFDSGQLSPNPPFYGEVFDYDGYVKWVANSSNGLQETLICLRRKIFEKIRFPDSRAVETLFHFELAKQFLILNCPDVLRLYHQDAQNSLCHSFAFRRVLETAPDQGEMHQTLIETHGNALRRYAKDVYLSKVRATASMLFLAGERSKGLYWAWVYLKEEPFSLSVILLSAAGLLGRYPVLLLKWLAFRRHIMRDHLL